jgi:hypothetical protein
MNPNLKAKTLKMAITSLPDPKSYPVDTITIRVGSENIKFTKHENEWYLK